MTEILTVKVEKSTKRVRVLDLFRRVTSSCTTPTYNSTGPLRPIYFGFRRATMASSGVGPDLDDWQKLVHLMDYFKADGDRPLILSADSGDLTWYVDSAFAAQANGRSHTGGFLRMRKRIRNQYMWWAEIEHERLNWVL